MAFPLIVEVFLAALVTDLATGLGAVPFFWVRSIPATYHGFAWGLAGGLMGAASIIDLVLPGMRLGGLPAVVLGGVVGVGFFLVGERVVHSIDVGFEDIEEEGSVKRILLILGVMTVHSFPEGIAIGLAFISGFEGLGLLLTLVIAIHNIPEGLAISIPLKSEGVSTWRCIGYSILSSVPQPIAAVIVVLMIDLLQDVLAPGFGFAAGAMIALVSLEIVPHGLEYGQRWSLLLGGAVGAVMMWGLNVLIRFPGV